MAISKESISAVRERADIVEEVGSRITLKKTGSNHVGLCPFHGEKTPSFNVSATKQSYHCFGCSASGDVIEFLMKHDGMLFHEAVKDLAERLGVALEEDQDAAGIRRAQQARKQASTLEEVCEKATVFYQRSLSQSKEAAQYALTRGLSQETIEHYGIGYAPNSWTALSTSFDNYSASEQLLAAGLVSDASLEASQDGSSKRGRIDRFRDRLIFPIRDVRGHCIGFGGRTINANAPHAPKYLNSPETQVFQKHKVLYGLHEARVAITREKLAYITEGYMDVVMMAQYGVSNAVAAMGTALSEDHVRVLLRFTDQVCFIFDGDKAGIAAAWKSLRVILPFLQSQHCISFLTLPDAQDPDEYLRQHGKDAFVALAGKAPALSTYLLGTLTKQYSSDGKLTTLEAKAQFNVAAEALAMLVPEENPLKGMLLQAIDEAVGRPARQTGTVAVKISAADRLRIASAQSYKSDAAYDAAGQTTQELPLAVPLKRAWLPMDEYLRTLPPKEMRSKTFNASNSSSTPLKHEQKKLWTQICNAVVIAPDTAATVADRILALLDQECPEEMTLQIVLQESHSIKADPEKYHADVLQSAKDLLLGAPKLISKLRTQEVKTELKTMLQEGVIDASEYSNQLLGLCR